MGERAINLLLALRFFTTLVKRGKYPLGEQIWADAQLHLPQGTHSTWREAITEQTISGSSAIAIGQILQHFPVGLLLNTSHS